LWITLNRPECGNLITTGMVNALKQALLSVSAETKLVVLAANGDDFCKGRDYSAAPEDAKNGKKPSTLEIYDRMTGPNHRLLYSHQDDARSNVGRCTRRRNRFRLRDVVRLRSRPGQRQRSFLSA
jgi:hypothetical protein